MLAAVAMLGGDRAIDVGVLGGTLATLAVAPRRSLLLGVVAGLAGTVVASALA